MNEFLWLAPLVTGLLGSFIFQWGVYVGRKQRKHEARTNPYRSQA